LLQIRPTKCTYINVISFINFTELLPVLGLTDPSSGHAVVQNNC